MNGKFFYTGLVIFYIFQFLSPNKPVYFASYFIAAYFFYLETKDLRISLLWALVLSVFSDVGIAGSWFLMEPQEFNLGSGWWISPMTLLIISLGFLSIRISKIKARPPDLLIFLFYIWNIVNLIFYPGPNVLYGLITLSEILTVYYIFRIYFSEKILPSVITILVSMLAFQSLVGFLQFLFRRNLGLMLESSLLNYQYGLTSTEDANIFRITGGYGHANMFAAVILALIPFLFVYRGKLIKIIAASSLINLLLTYSRAAWFIGFPSFVLIYLKYNIDTAKEYIFRNKIKIILLSYLAFLILIPVVSVRLQSVPVAFEENGSFSTRIKLIQESLSLILAYPFLGVGINNFQPAASESPVTDVFAVNGYNAVTRIHNLFFELAAQIGIPGLLIFCLFLASLYIFYKHRNFHDKRTAKISNLAGYSLLCLILIASFNPFYLITQFRLFFLLAAIIMV